MFWFTIPQGQTTPDNKVRNASNTAAA